MKITKIHHVAYRCKNAKETTEWYKKYLNMDLVLSIAENEVPSTKAPDPYMHIFLDAGAGNILAFFEIPSLAEMGRDPNTPDWVQHLAFEVETMDDLVEAKARLEADGIDVVGVTDHAIFQSIYFFDPSGHRLELACNTHTDQMMSKLDEVKFEMIEEWEKTKIAPQHARWMHDGSYKDM